MPDPDELAVLAVLTDPQRRAVFDQVQAAPDCTVAQLAEALNVGRTLVTFHLGKLLDAGLVEVVAAQRRPGAVGRPSQRYRLSGLEVSASVPDRRYDLLASVLLDALADPRQGESAQAAAERVARRSGAALAARPGSGRAARSRSAVLGRLAALLSSLGYRPRREDATLVLGNCPFDRFRADHTEQVCTVNLALCEGYLAGLGLTAEVRAQLRPCADTCCVVFEAALA